MHWRLNRIQYPVYNLGPGKRIGIWAQGCSLNCPGCINPSLWNPDGGRSVGVEWLLQTILNRANEYDGITITGGEPFDQYEPLIAFCSYIRLKTNLNLFVYSGYTLEEIEQKHSNRLFASCIDYLLEGRYVHELNRNESLRGSANQRLYRFTNREKTEMEVYPEKPLWSVHVSDDNEIFLTGIPAQDDMRSIQNELAHAGIKTEFV